jgi:hypothetical protein
VSSKNLLNRNDIAGLINASVDVVRKNEARLGILPFKKPINRRNILYQRAGVLKALTERGFLEELPKVGK